MWEVGVKMEIDFPVDPRIKNVDNELVKVAFEEFKQNIDLVGIHLRDARNILYALNAEGLKDERVLSKAAILLAAAALDSNLAYISRIALGFAEKRPGKYLPPQLDYLRGITEKVDDRGQLVKFRLKQSLVERLRLVPTLLAKSIDREFKLADDSAASRKLRRMIERRDAIAHPRWDKYVVDTGRWEAAEAIDSVELYLEAVRDCMHPYLVGYLTMLLTIRGPSKHDVGVGYRTYGKRGPNRKIATMDEVGIREVLVNEWIDSLMLVHLAFLHGTEKDSEGSMLTRVALIMLYAMLDAQLAVVAQWRMRESPASFREAEILYLNEVAVRVGHDAEVWLEDDNHSFKSRIKAIPAILSRRVDHKEYVVNLGTKWGENLLNGYTLRNEVMHSGFSGPMPRISKDELRVSANAIRSYFEDLAMHAPVCFGHMTPLLGDTDKFLA
jgi:hypothetical protein